jgi:hypothetical protein
MSFYVFYYFCNAFLMFPIVNTLHPDNYLCFRLFYGKTSEYILSAPTG